ncbi:hypothetical protein JW796_01605 [Candidatus Dojkabacteria bacterium]|nr:hypothetical protein [Candidatus Dojkabacteria bacterium]
MKIFLFRHGEKQEVESTDFSVKRGVTLSKFGIIQIQKLAEILNKRFPELCNLPFIFRVLFPVQFIVLK